MLVLLVLLACVGRRPFAPRVLYHPQILSQPVVVDREHSAGCDGEPWVPVGREVQPPAKLRRALFNLRAQPVGHANVFREEVVSVRPAAATCWNPHSVRLLDRHARHTAGCCPMRDVDRVHVSFARPLQHHLRERLKGLLFAPI